MSRPTLVYFHLPGRAEVSRLLFTLGKTDFEDKRISFEDWKNKPELKAKKPFGQLPVLKVDGKVLAQSAAIDRYVAKVTGLLPEDPWLAALADQAYAFVEADLWPVVGATNAIADPAAEIKARQELVKGTCPTQHICTQHTNHSCHT